MNTSDADPGPNPNTVRLIEQVHALYCELTGQHILLRFNWQRSWFELLRWGFTLDDVRCVVCYLQQEILQGRRNLGALKLSNLLQPDRFEEDLNISRVRLKPPRTQRKPPLPAPALAVPPMNSQQQREASVQFDQLRQSLQTTRRTQH
ncbi:MAG: hypothetical protein ACO3LT_08645 [Ilumatobacteraceae bacterium]